MKFTNRMIILTLIVISLISCAAPKIEWKPASETDHFIFFVTEGSENAVP